MTAISHDVQVLRAAENGGTVPRGDDVLRVQARTHHRPIAAKTTTPTTIATTNMVVLATSIKIAGAARVAPRFCLLRFGRRTR